MVTIVIDRAGPVAPLATLSGSGRRCCPRAWRWAGQMTRRGSGPPRASASSWTRTGSTGPGSGPWARRRLRGVVTHQATEAAALPSNTTRGRCLPDPA